MTVRRGMRAVATITAFVLTIGSYTAQAAQAAMADPPTPATNAIRGALDGAQGVKTFINGLGGVGGYAQPAPGLTLVPATALSFGNLMDGALGEVSDYASATTVSELASAFS